LLHALRVFNRSVLLSCNCGYSTGGLWMKGALIGKVYSCFCDHQAFQLSHFWCSLMEYLCRTARRVEARCINAASLSHFCMCAPPLAPTSLMCRKHPSSGLWPTSRITVWSSSRLVTGVCVQVWVCWCLMKWLNSLRCSAAWTSSLA
jgi:hypothetical protein